MVQSFPLPRNLVQLIHWKGIFCTNFLTTYYLHLSGERDLSYGHMEMLLWREIYITCMILLQLVFGVNYLLTVLIVMFSPIPVETVVYYDCNAMYFELAMFTVCISGFDYTVNCAMKFLSGLIWESQMKIYFKHSMHVWNWLKEDHFCCCYFWFKNQTWISME